MDEIHCRSDLMIFQMAGHLQRISVNDGKTKADLMTRETEENSKAGYRRPSDNIGKRMPYTNSRLFSAAKAALKICFFAHL